MKEVIKEGKVKKRKATCKECGTEFTFYKSDVEKEVDYNTFCYPQREKEYVTCPKCHEKIYNWDYIED